MVKVNAPALSLDASGSLGGALVFSKWKGRPYVRTLVKPANPRSAGQITTRAIMKFLAQQWTALSAPEKASYEALADAANISPFNAFCQYNARRWYIGSGPTQLYPAAEVATPSGIGAFTATPGLRNVLVQVDIDAGDDSWAVAIAMSLVTGFTPGWGNVIAILAGAPSETVFLVHSPLDPDTYYYRAAVLTTDGIIGPWEAEINAVVS